MYTLHTNTKLNCAYISCDVRKILMIGQNEDGVTSWISEIATAWPPMWVDYVKSVDSAMCGKHAVSNFGARFW